jgi:hypothetical protein
MQDMSLPRLSKSMRIGFLLVGLLLSVMRVEAHDAISADARKVYLSRLDELTRTAQGNSPVTVRANAWLEMGKTLDEIRALLNEDIISHGKTQGLLVPTR